MLELEVNFESLYKNHMNIIGIDVNTKNNIFALSDGKKFEHSQKIVNLCEQVNNSLNKRKKLKFSLKEMSRQYLINSTLDLLAYCKEMNYNHIVLEDLDMTFEHKYIDGVIQFNYNRFAELININNVKNIIKKMANECDIMVSFVNPDYTSQQCPHCGYISKENRENKTFICKHCQKYIGDADIVAAINIRNRVADDEIRNELMFFDKHFNGFLESNIFTKNSYRKIINDRYLRGNPVENFNN